MLFLHCFLFCKPFFSFLDLDPDPNAPDPQQCKNKYFLFIYLFNHSRIFLGSRKAGHRPMSHLILLQLHRINALYWANTRKGLTSCEEFHCPCWHIRVKGGDDETFFARILICRKCWVLALKKSCTDVKKLIPNSRQYGNFIRGIVCIVGTVRKYF